MMFANVSFILFLIISIVVFGFLILLVRQIKRDGQLSQDKLKRLTALLFMPAVLVFLLIFYGLSSWRAEIKAQQTRAEIAQFVTRVYKPLGESQESLLQSARGMRRWLDGIERLRGEFPNHQKLLQQINTEWLASQKRLFQLYSDTDKEIRHAWISYQTLNQQDVFDKFYTKAVHLNNHIEKVNKDNQLNLRGVQDELVKSIDEARQLLSTKKSNKRKRKKKKKQTKELEQNIADFNETTITTLLNYLSVLDDGLSVEVRHLQENIRLARQRHEEVMLYLEDNPDLRQPLEKVLQGWQRLQTQNQNDLNKILYTVEAQYIARKLGLPKNNPAAKAMRKQFKQKIPAIVSKAKKQREELERSYNIK